MQFRRVGKPSVGINIAPLVDVVFLLVIFFAVSTTFLETAGLELELPTSSATAKRGADNLVVSVTQDGQVALNGERLSVEDLTERLRRELEGNTGGTVSVRADRRTPHGDVVRVIDAINDSGAVGLQLEARAGGN